MELYQYIKLLSHNLNTAVCTLRAHYNVYLPLVCIRGNFWVIFGAYFDVRYEEIVDHLQNE